MSENLELYVRACLQRAVHIIIQSRCANGNNKRAVAKDLHTINSPDNGEGIESVIEYESTVKTSDS